MFTSRLKSWKYRVLVSKHLEFWAFISPMGIPVSSDILCFNTSSRFKRSIAFKCPLTLEVQSSRSSTLAEQEPFLGWFVYIAGREQTILKIYQDIRTLLLYLHLIFMKIPTSGQDLPKTQTDTSRDILLGGPVPYLELFWAGPVKKPPCMWMHIKKHLQSQISQNQQSVLYYWKRDRVC